MPQLLFAAMISILFFILLYREETDLEQGQCQMLFLPEMGVSQLGEFLAWPGDTSGTLC